MQFLKSIAIVAGLFWFIGCNAIADDLPPPIDMTVVILDLHNKPIPDGNDRTVAEAKEDPDCVRCSRMTLGSACYYALVGMAAKRDPHTGEFVLDAGQRQAYVGLAVSLQDASQPSGYTKTARLGVKPLDKIKDAVGAFYPGTLIYRILPLIDPVGSSKPPELK